MTTIDKGEFFIVTRGYPYNMDAINWFGFTETSPRKQLYDRSFEGVVFEAMESTEGAVAARIVFRNKGKEHLSETMSLSLREIEVMPVSRQYVEALGVGSAARAAPAGREGE